MNHKCIWFGVFFLFTVSWDARGQEGKTPSPPAPVVAGAGVAESGAFSAAGGELEDPLAQSRGKAADGNDKPSNSKPSFPVGGFKGNTDGLVPLLPPNEIANRQRGRRSPRQRPNQQQQKLQGRNQPQAFGNQIQGGQIQGGQWNQFGGRTPIYVPGYNPNRPYGYPWGTYPGYGGGYPGLIYPGYGYGYGYIYRPGGATWVPGSGSGSPVGGSNYFGNPHASQYIGNPHASQGK